ncbi:mamu class II histocompatibility antigen, DR alpha chain-like isoform X1 [Parambassis ranga]|uniref:Mamu class II histocompatibility antigen, DR alpha chain-like isoform X1 n=1 Tax=Parambassis ranga TaxID=210632 RepID=A0A6P7HGQ2_9TELE|nr:mamu class II histocompatibility antigen, DR alpha chain-like isoform X1 [Parambassis ranga]
MRMMKVSLLVLCGVLCVSADVLHEGIYITGCSDSDGEDMYTLDGEELWYADFIHKTGVYPQPSFIDPVRYEEGTYQQAEVDLHNCQSNVRIVGRAMKDFPLEQDPPSTPMIYTRGNMDLGVRNTLICHVSGFYPAPVKVSWTKNGDNVTEKSSINVPFPNKDGYFTQISRLQFVPEQGDIYSCTVDHLALTEPLTRIWDVEKTPPGVGPAVFCGLGLTVGLLGVAAGTFFLIKGNECS